MSATHSTTQPVYDGAPPAIPGGEYRPIGRFPGYLFGSDGTVWSCRQGERPAKITSQWRRIRGTVTKGYHQAGVTEAGHRRRRNFFVHSLILEAFVGPKPEGMECCHEDRNPLNNTVGNLRWDYPAGNTADKIRHGTVCVGSQCGAAKLTEAAAVEIRRLRSEGAMVKELAKRFGVDVRTVSRVVSRAIWKHV
jgi:hypothetical protein